MDHSFHLPVVFDKSNVEGHFILSGYREGGHWRMVLDAANKYTSEIHDPVFPIIGSGETYEDAMMEVFAQFEDQFYSSRPLA